MLQAPEHDLCVCITDLKGNRIDTHAGVLDVRAKLPGDAIAFRRIPAGMLCFPNLF
jgi:hypothetical protein